MLFLPSAIGRRYRHFALSTFNSELYFALCTLHFALAGIKFSLAGIKFSLAGIKFAGLAL